MLSASEETYEQILCGGLEDLDEARQLAFDTIYAKQEEGFVDSDNEEAAIIVS
jgi:hypothetical protein